MDTYRTLTVHQKGTMPGVEDRVMTKINLFPYLKEITVKLRKTDIKGEIILKSSYLDY